MTENRSYKEATIFLVDDDDVDAMAVERALTNLKIANPVVRARDGVEALALLREPGQVRRPYIILLDINMPRMNGIEMLVALRADPALSSAVVFVLTTSKSDEDRVAAYKQHVAGYIVKNKVSDGFMSVITLIDQYWRVVELPVNS